MRKPGPGVFFKIFLACLFLASCGQKHPKTGTYALTRFLPTTQARMLELKASKKPQILDGGNLRIIHEITAPTLVKTCLGSFPNSAFNMEYICDNLEGELVDGTVCLRFYCPDRNFSVRFLDTLLAHFMAYKNAGIRDSMGLQLKDLDVQLTRAKNYMQHQHDSIVCFKEHYNLPASAEEMNQMLSSGAYVLDSAVAAGFFQLQLELQKCLEQCARLTKERDNLQLQVDASCFSFYMVDQPHYVVE